MSDMPFQYQPLGQTMDFHLARPTPPRKRRRSDDASSSPSLQFLYDFQPRVQLTRTPKSLVLHVHLQGFRKEEVRLEMERQKRRLLLKAHKLIHALGSVSWTWDFLQSSSPSSSKSSSSSSSSSSLLRRPFEIPACVETCSIFACFHESTGILEVVMPFRHSLPSSSSSSSSSSSKQSAEQQRKHDADDKQKQPAFPQISKRSERKSEKEGTQRELIEEKAQGMALRGDEEKERNAGRKESESGLWTARIRFDNAKKSAICAVAVAAAGIALFSCRRLVRAR